MPEAIFGARGEPDLITIRLQPVIENRINTQPVTVEKL